LFPTKIHFHSDNTTAILKEVKKEKGVYEYQDGFYFKGKLLELTEGEVEKMIRKQIIKIK
jgi:hypothetical protein